MIAGRRLTAARRILFRPGSRCGSCEPAMIRTCHAASPVTSLRKCPLLSSGEFMRWCAATLVPSDSLSPVTLRYRATRGGHCCVTVQTDKSGTRGFDRRESSSGQSGQRRQATSGAVPTGNTRGTTSPYLPCLACGTTGTGKPVRGTIVGTALLCSTSHRSRSCRRISVLADLSKVSSVASVISIMESRDVFRFRSAHSAGCLVPAERARS